MLFMFQAQDVFFLSFKYKMMVLSKGPLLNTYNDYSKLHISGMNGGGKN